MSTASNGYPATGRRRPRRGPLLVTALLLVAPALELGVLVVVGRWIGGWPTLGLVIITSAVGVAVVVRQAPRTWRWLRESLRVEHLAAGRLPGAQVLDGAIALLGGVLLAAPGLVTDVLAVPCLLPFVRPALRRLVMVWLTRRATALGRRVRPAGFGRVVRAEVVDAPTGDPRSGHRRSDRHGTGHPVVEGSVVEGSVVEGSVVHPPGDESPTTKR